MTRPRMTEQEWAEYQRRTRISRSKISLGSARGARHPQGVKVGEPHTKDALRNQSTKGHGNVKSGARTPQATNNMVRSGTEGRASTPGAQGRLVTRREPVSSPVSSPSFIVHGVAMGKPRMTQQDKWKQRPAVMRYRAWCDLVRFAAGVQAPMVLTQGVRLSVIVYLPCPASWSQARREQRMGTPHVSKPDLDNLVKGLMDALVVNDSFVWMIEATKFWDNRLGPHVVVRIEE